ncbi:trigger factor [Clostridium massiliamazoniense]|uniref:trigger factor n=1 Tax=Clostridium massiliamazoniense TaxID=1347366 RepID=UPI0006D81B82|nr:trigger factor [Clostridium massiliamazoniense]
MEVKVQQIETNVVELEVKVEAKQFKEALDKAFKKNAHRFNVPGFRKGKVPMAIVKKQYGAEVLYNDAIDICIRETYEKALDEKDVNPVSLPEVDIVEVGEGKDLIYKAKITVMPEVKLGDYKGVSVKEVSAEVKEEEIEKQLKDMQEKNARIESKVDGKVEKGDIAVIDFKGFIDDVAFEGGEGTDYQLEIGSGTFIGNFEDQLIGLAAGEKKDVIVTFPEQYGKEELNGKEAKFEVTVKDIKVKELPELDDEFATEVSEFDTIAELKADLTKKAEEVSKERAEAELKEAVVNVVVDNATIEIPEVMIENETTNMVKDLEQRLSYQGIGLAQYFQLTGQTEEQMRSYMKENAERKVKTDLVLSEITNVEKIDATEEEVKERANEVAKMYGAESEKIAEMLIATQERALKADIIRNKTVDMLVKEAKIEK